MLKAHAETLGHFFLILASPFWLDTFFIRVAFFGAAAEDFVGRLFFWASDRLRIGRFFPVSTAVFLDKAADVDETRDVFGALLATGSFF